MEDGRVRRVFNFHSRIDQTCGDHHCCLTHVAEVFPKDRPAFGKFAVSQLPLAAASVANINNMFHHAVRRINRTVSLPHEFSALPK
jgi:hypothetical protein